MNTYIKIQPFHSFAEMMCTSFVLKNILFTILAAPLLDHMYILLFFILLS